MLWAGQQISLIQRQLIGCLFAQLPLDKTDSNVHSLLLGMHLWDLTSKYKQTTTAAAWIPERSASVA